jgi:hypothetical protein
MAIDLRNARAALSQQAEPVDAHESTRMYHFAIKREQRLRELIGLVVEHVESPDHDGGISNALRQRLIDEMAAPPAAQQAEPVGEKRIANAIHYPACWDTAAYPELDDALAEMFQAFRCQECAPPADEAVRLLERARTQLRDEAVETLLAIDAYLAKAKP